MAYPDVVIADAPQAYWQCNETSGSVLADSSGFGRDLSLVGAYTLGVEGRSSSLGAAVAFTSGYAQIASPPAALRIVNDLTIEFWLRKDVWNGRINPLQTHYSKEYAFSIEGNDQSPYRDGVGWYHGATTSSYYGGIWVGGIAAGDWNHIVLTRDRANRRYHLYIDGRLVVVESWAGQVDPTVGTDPLMVGRGYIGTDLNGRMQHVAIYDRMLSTSEVAEHFQAGVPQSERGFGAYISTLTAGPNPAPLWGRWKLDDNNPATLADSSGNGRNVAIPVSTQNGMTLRTDGPLLNEVSKSVLLPGTIGGATEGVTGTFSGGMAGSFAFGAWVYMPPLGTNVRGGVIGMTASGSASSGVYVGVGSANFDAAGRNVIGLHEGVAWNDTGYVLTEGWHFLSMTSHTTSSAIYCDGHLLASWSSSRTAGTYDTVVIGGSTNRQFNGRIGEALIWSADPGHSRHLKTAMNGRLTGRSDYYDTVLASAPRWYSRFDAWVDGTTVPAYYRELAGYNNVNRGSTSRNATNRRLPLLPTLGMAQQLPSNAAVVFPADTGVDFLQAHTIEFVGAYTVRFSPNGYANMISKSDGSQQRSMVGVNSNAIPGLTRQSSNTSANQGQFQSDAGGTAEAGRWNYYEIAHWAVVIDGDNSATRNVLFYKNGVLVQTVPIEARFRTTSGTNFRVGNDNDAFWGYTQMVVSDVALYQRALPQTEIANHYHNASSLDPKAPFLATGTMTTTPSVQYGGSSYRKSVMTSSPQRYWRFDETTGTVAKDAIGNQDGTFANVTLAQPTVLEADTGYSVLFNGTSSSMATPATTYSPWAGTSAACTLECVFNVTVAPPNNGAHRTFMAKGQANQWEMMFSAYNDASGNRGLHFVIYRNDGQHHMSVVQLNNYSLNAWHHAAFVYDRPAGLCIAYLDGVEFGRSTTVSGTAPTAFNQPIYVGRRSDGHYMQGYIDEPAIYNRALTPQEIAAHAGWVFAAKATMTGTATFRPGYNRIITRAAYTGAKRLDLFAEVRNFMTGTSGTRADTGSFLWTPPLRQAVNFDDARFGISNITPPRPFEVEDETKLPYVTKGTTRPTRP